MTSSFRVVYGAVALVAFISCFSAVTSQKTCSKKSDIIFILDQSGSIEDANPKNGSWDNWQLIKNFINSLVKSSTVSFQDTHFGLVTFGNQAVIRFNLTTYYDANAIVNAVNQVPPGNGQTNLYAGLNYARTIMFPAGGRPGVPRACIIITDGFANLNTAQTIPEANNLKSDGTMIFAIGVTSLIDENQLKAVSSDPQEKNKNYWTTPDFTQLQSILEQVQEATCDPPKQVLNACQVLDLAIAVDIPQDPNDFMAVKYFIEQFITLYIPIGTDAVQVSVVTFDNARATIQFPLSRYTNEDDLKQYIDSIPFVPGNTGDPTLALQTIRQQVFQPANGARPNAKKTVLVFMNNNLPNRMATITEAQTFRNNSVRVIGIGMTIDAGIQDLRIVATSDREVVSTTGYSFLNTKLTLLDTVLCNPDSTWNVACPTAADIVLILDESTSIVSAAGGYTNWYTYILGFAQEVVNAFPESQDLTHIGLFTFSYYARKKFDLTSYYDRATINSVISKLELAGGETNIADALRQARTVGFSSQYARPKVPHVCILITDGEANVEATSTLLEANLTKAAGIEIYTIGVTENINIAQLKAIASYPPENHYFYVSDYSQLNTILNQLISTSCNDLPTLSTTTTTASTTPMKSTSSAATTPTPSTPTPSTPTPTTPTPTPTTSTPTPSTPTPSTPTPSTPTPSTPTPSTPTPSTPTPSTPTPSTPTPSTPTPSTSTPTPTTSTPTPTTSTPTTPTPSTPTPSTPTPSTPTPTTTTTPSTTTTVITGNPGRLSTRNPNVIEEQAGCRKMADVAFLVDRTNNLNYNYFTTYLVDLMKKIVAQLDVDGGRAYISAITYAETAKVEFYLSNYTNTSDTFTALAKLSYGGAVANLADAFRLARESVFQGVNGARSGIGVSRVVIVFIDNVSTNQTAALAEADRLKKELNVTIVMVGIGTYLNMYEIHTAASYPAENNSFTVSTARDLPTLEDPVKRIACADDGSCRAAGCPAGCVEIGNSYQCTCPVGMAGPKCDRVCKNGGDIVFAVPTSNRNGLPYINSITAFIKTIIQSWDIDSSADGPTVSRVGLVTYASTANISFYQNAYSQDREGLLNAINPPYTGGNDNVAEAIKTIRTQMFGSAFPLYDYPDKSNYLVLFMDGQSDNQTATFQEAVLARAAGITIIVVSITQNGNMVELSGIASAPLSSNLIVASDVSQLNDTMREEVSGIVCKNQDPCLSNPCQNGAQCQAIPGGYTCGPCPLQPPSTGLRCERACSGVQDVVFILDGAGTVHLERWNYVLEFVIKVVQMLDVHPDRTRVGLIYYSSDAFVGFYLNTYSNRQDVISAIRNIPYLGNRTNTASALRLLRRDMFNPTNGDRPGAINIGVIVANGDSTVDSTLTVGEASQNRILGNTLIGVAVETQMYYSLEFEGIVSFPRDLNTLRTPSFTSLPDMAETLVNTLCQNVSHCAPNPCKNGGTCVEQFNGYQCLCPTGITGEDCERTCNKKMDLVLILDNSGSVQEEYRQSVNFSREVVMGLDVNSDNVRVGCIAYSNDLVGQFYMNQNVGNLENVFNSLDFYVVFGTTNTPAALQAAKDSQFTAARGDRPDVPNYIVIVTDGYSNVNQQNTIPFANDLKSSGVTIYSIAVGDGPQYSELNEMATSPASQYVIPLPSIGDIQETAKTLLDRLCQQ